MKSQAIVTSLAMIFAANMAQAQSTTTDIVGCWKVQSVVIDRAGEKLEPFGPKPVGQLTFTPDGHMSVIQMRPDLPEGSTGEPDGKIVGTFMAYFGTYEVQGKTITLKIEGSTRSDWRNKTLNRTLESVSPTDFVWVDRPSKDMAARLSATRCQTAT